MVSEFGFRMNGPRWRGALFPPARDIPACLISPKLFCPVVVNSGARNRQALRLALLPTITLKTSTSPAGFY